MTTNPERLLEIHPSQRELSRGLSLELWEGSGLVESLLREQAALDALREGDGVCTAPTPSNKRALIPERVPGPGEQLAFEVDLDRCTGAGSCVTGCHNMNGLDDDETWRQVGQIHGEGVPSPLGPHFQQHVTSSCHHCVDPACLNGCPVNAYEKDPITGIVAHLDDQCIGCSYCTLKCPYGAPQYNPVKGIVRKCDMCVQRLAVGEAPGCVQACPNSAIKIVITKQDEVIKRSEANTFLPGAPDPAYTQPTTLYKTKRALPEILEAVDHHRLEPAEAHLPLVIMLVLSQLSVGALGLTALARLTGWEIGRLPLAVSATTALIIGLMAIGASTLHLGRPLYAFRAVLGFRTSWLSREILAFGGYVGGAGLFVASLLYPLMGERFTILPNGLVSGAQLAQGPLAIAAPTLGAIGVLCSIMLYVDTRRALWSLPRTSFQFLSTVLGLGAASLLTSSVITAAILDSVPLQTTVLSLVNPTCTLVILASLPKLAASWFGQRALGTSELTAPKRRVLLMRGALRKVAVTHFLCACVGGLLLPLLLLTGVTVLSLNAPLLILASSLMLLTLLLGELSDRFLFFTTVDVPNMPGGFRA